MAISSELLRRQVAANWHRQPFAGPPPYRTMRIGNLWMVLDGKGVNVAVSTAGAVFQNSELEASLVSEFLSQHQGETL